MDRPVLLRRVTHALLLLYVFSGCVSRDEPRPSDCDGSDLVLTVSSQANPTGCTTSDGNVAVAATGGVSPYQFSINNDAYSDSNEFTALGAGVYVLNVKDAKGCVQSQEVTLTIPGSTLAATVSAVADNQCLTDNGSLSVEANGGIPPYQYQLGTAAFVSTPTFSNLKNGSYVITVKDNSGCTLSLSTSVSRGSTGISYNSEVKSIFTAKCATSGCHGGGQSPNLSTLSSVQSNSRNIQSRIESGSMPPSGSTPLTADEKAKIVCWVEDGANNN